MTLTDSVNLIVKDMEDRLASGEKEFYADSVKGWILAIKIALKANPNPQPDIALQTCDPRTQELVQRAWARRQQRTHTGVVVGEVAMATCQDGPEKGTSIPIRSHSEEGETYTVTVGKSVYRLRGGKLYEDHLSG